eukprot:TRINITY_DN3964_c0_g1_i10.p1 TRINITY_DN3964_c0_g1~~TRINITY_DN3964_c0_g1_i10.p1  ORF type:complete len:489 (+),score=100.01 TRINITY_DN3964_c0_g1_i10:80-1546(+)
MAWGRYAYLEAGDASGAKQSSPDEAASRQSANTMTAFAGAGDGAAKENTSSVYDRELLLSVRTFLGKDAAPNDRLTTRNLSPLGSPRAQSDASMKRDSTSYTRSGSSSSQSSEAPDAADLSSLLLPSAVDMEPVLPPPGLGPASLTVPTTHAQESLSEELEQEIEAATAAAWRAMKETEAAAMAPEAAWGTSARGSWGRGGDFSQLLSRLRRAPGASVALAVLRQEAPYELRAAMRDGTTFSTWLSHRTGLIEVSGAIGEEVVVLSTPQKSRQFAEAAESFQAVNSFCFDPSASEFVMPVDNEDADFAQPEDSGAALPTALAEAALADSVPDNLTVAEAHQLLMRARMAEDATAPAAFRGPPGLCSEEEQENLQVWQGKEDAQYWQQFDECPLWLSEDQSLDIEDEKPLVKTGGLNPKAVEFRPTISLAEYSQARKLGSARRKATRTRQQFEASGIPDAIPEDQATGSDATTSNDEEESLATLAAVAA